MTRPIPPAAVLAYARTYRCHDCPADIGEPWIDEYGVWHVNIAHEPDCPVIHGTVSKTNAGISAALRVARGETER